MHFFNNKTTTILSVQIENCGKAVQESAFVRVPGAFSGRGELCEVPGVVEVGG